MTAPDQTPAQIPAKLPPSDVSPWVGLVGLITLLGCILIARSWPEIEHMLGSHAHRGRLSGPNAALLTMVLTGAAMAAWSVLVDKVHRNPSTGIDWDNKRSLSAAMETAITKIAGLWATWAVIGFFYSLARWYWSGNYQFAMEVIAVVAVPMFVLSVPYVLWLDRVLINPRDHCWHFGAMLIGRDKWDGEQIKKHWRAWAIKGFFSAFMISILPLGFASVVEAPLHEMAGDPVRIGLVLFELLFVIDVQIGTVGYLLTMRPLDAHIRSGNPYLAGWVAALLCYPPFVYGFMGDGGAIQYEYNTADWAYWFAGYPALLWLWAAWLAFLTGVYAWATVAFGIRFSNLTYRGVLTNGPYRYTRHPAYLSKNMFWWCSVLPFLVTSDDLGDSVRNTVFLAIVSGIYFWRAKTEEAHLKAEDARYGEYYAWMEEHGAITSRLSRLLNGPKPRGAEAALEPAE